MLMPDAKASSWTFRFAPDRLLGHLPSTKELCEDLFPSQDYPPEGRQTQISEDPGKVEEVDPLLVTAGGLRPQNFDELFFRR